ncbi:MAG: tetratricopeptide repeat protein, partial [Hyphococcus sp.]
MLFWFLILFVSLGMVIGVAGPMIRAARSAEAREAVRKKQGLPFMSLALIAAAPIAAGAVYLAVGAPYSLSPTFTAGSEQTPASMTAEERAAMVEGMVANLAARLQEDPDDAEGWRMLARSYGVLGRAEESAAAYRQLLARDPEAGAEDWRNYATALLAARPAGATDYDEAFTDALEKLQGFNEDDPLALFYLGLVARDR